MPRHTKGTGGTLWYDATPIMSHDIEGTRSLGTRPPFSKGAMSGRTAGGDVNLGEMEKQKMVGNGLKNCLEELQVKGKMSVVEVCTGCVRISMLCDCTMVALRLPSNIVEMATRVLVSSNLSLSIR